jgi:hypothetical protein
MACVEYNGAIFCEGKTNESRTIFTQVNAIVQFEDRKQFALDVIERSNAVLEKLDLIDAGECIPASVVKQFKETRKLAQQENAVARIEIEWLDYLINQRKCEANKYGANFSCNPNLKPPAKAEGRTTKSKTRDTGKTGKAGRNTSKGERGKDGASLKSARCAS